MISIKIYLKFEQITTEEIVIAVSVEFVQKHPLLTYRRIRNPRAYIE